MLGSIPWLPLSPAAGLFKSLPLGSILTSVIHTVGAGSLLREPSGLIPRPWVTLFTIFGIGARSLTMVSVCIPVRRYSGKKLVYVGVKREEISLSVPARAFSTFAPGVDVESKLNFLALAYGCLLRAVVPTGRALEAPVCQC